MAPSLPEVGDQQECGASHGQVSDADASLSLPAALEPLNLCSVSTSMPPKSRKPEVSYIVRFVEEATLMVRTFRER